MALNRAPESGKQWRYGVLPEATYGTSDEGQSNICELSCEHITIDRGVNIDKVKGSHGSKDPIRAERHQNLSGSIATGTITMPLNPYAASTSSFWLMLASHFQYQSSNVFSYFDTHPSGDGVDYSYTLFCKNPVDDEDEVVTGCKISLLTLLSREVKRF